MRPSIFVIVGAMLALAAPQQTSQRRLQPRDAQLAEEFQRVFAVRELADRRILIADAGEGRIVLADFGSATLVPIARRGQGPGEFWALKEFLS